MRLPAIFRFAALTALALSLFSATFTRTLHAQSPAASLSAADIDRLTGDMWSGTLEYRDYTSNKQTTIRSTLRVSRLLSAADTAPAWEMRVGYNDEPNANSRDTARLSDNGRLFRGEQVTGREMLPDGTLRVVTEQSGTDNERPAQFRFVYLIGGRAASVQKLVRYSADDSFFERHIYRWSM